MTPHNSAKKGDFAKTVLMPGDPLRAKFIADNFLTDAVLVNNVRGVQGYTGFYKGKRVSVMASGMGMPSIGIYSHELFNSYDVDNIIRVGSAGALSERLEVRDIVLAMSAHTDSNFGRQFGFSGTLAPSCSYELLESAVDTARKMGLRFQAGTVFSSDLFYDAKPTPSSITLSKIGCLAVEMETHALYLNAAAAGKNALSILTISDHLLTGKELPSEERQTSFTDMMTLALEIAR